MSKSLGNAVGIQDPPREMFGKLMSISDELMQRYYDQLSQVPWVERADTHPLEAKKALAFELVARFHDEAEAADARGFFESRHQARRPVDPEEHRVAPDADGRVGICQLLKDVRFAASKSEARRLILQGAVRVDGETVRDVDYRFQVGRDRLLQVGRRRLARVEAP